MAAAADDPLPKASQWPETMAALDAPVKGILGELDGNGARLSGRHAHSVPRSATNTGEGTAILAARSGSGGDQ
jgi:hypothetical protein